MSEHYTATVIVTKTTDEVPAQLDQYNRTRIEGKPRIVTELGKTVVRSDSLEGLDLKIKKVIGVITEV